VVNRDRRRFYIYLLGVLVAAGPVGHMFFSIWDLGVSNLVMAVTLLPLIPDGVPGVEAIVIFGFFVYASWLFLFVNDHRKRYQGVIILSGTGAILGVLWFLGIGIPNIKPRPPNGVAAIAGFTIGLTVELFQTEDLEGQLLEVDWEQSSIGYVVDDEGIPIEFPVASRALVMFARGLVIAGFVIYALLAFPGFAPLVELTQEAIDYIGIVGGYGLFSALFLVALDRFVQFNIGETPESVQFEVLGPIQSGKSYFALGLYLTALDANNSEYRISGTPSGGMQDLLNEYQDQTDSDAELDWNIANTPRNETKDRSFEFVAEWRRFPAEYRMSMTDHGGEILADVSETIKHKTEESSPETMADGGTSPEDEDDDVADNQESNKDFEMRIEEMTDENPLPIDSDADDDRGSEAAEEESPTPEDENDDEDETDKYKDTAEKYRDSVNEGTDTDSSSDSSPDIGSETDSAGGLDASKSDSTDGSDVKSSRSDQEDESTRAKAIKKVVKSIEEADRLIFLFDMERSIGKDPTGTGSNLSMQVRDYLDIVGATDKDDYIFIASKADYVIDQWRDAESLNESSHPHDTEQQWSTFRDYVTNELRNQNANIQTIVQQTSTGTIYPVYFRTEKRDGDIKMIPDDDGKIQPEGFQRVLDRTVEEN